MKVNHGKILYITYEYDERIAGGVGRVLNGIVPAIREKIDLHVLLMLVKKHCLYRMQDNQWEEKIYRGPLKLDNLEKIMATENYDIVHVFHVSLFIYEIIKFIEAKFPQVKLVYSCHSINKYEYQIRNSHPDFLEYENFVFNQADHIHLLNQSSFQYLKESYPEIAAQKPYTIISNGIDEGSFVQKDSRFQRKMARRLKKKQLKDGKERITVLCMSRWSRGKGLEYLLDAIPKVVARYPYVWFVIAGRKSVSWEYRYNDFLWHVDHKIATMRKHVIPLNWLNDRQRNTLFTFADIWVMPSLLEYFPFSILEPMIARIPIVSSRISSVQEMLSDNQECLFYEPEKPDQLAEKICTLIESPGLRSQIAQNAYQMVKQYQWDSIAKMYLKMYQTVLNHQETGK